MEGGICGRTGFAGDVSEVENVEVAALGSAAAAEGWVDLGNGDRGASGESKDSELHCCDCCWFGKMK